MSKSRTPLARAEARIVARAEAFPEVQVDTPWGERAFKVRGKTFLFLSHRDGVLALSVKLPVSGGMALALPFTEPTHYGLGRSGWVTATFGSGHVVPVDVIDEWLDESFAAIAPKKVAAARAATPSGPASAPPRAPVPAAAKKKTRPAKKALARLAKR